MIYLALACQIGGLYLSWWLARAFLRRFGLRWWHALIAGVIAVVPAFVGGVIYAGAGGEVWVVGTAFFGAIGLSNWAYQQVERERQAQGAFKVPAGTSIMFSSPPKEPVALLDSVARFCKAHPHIRAAFRAQIYIMAPGEKTHIAVALDLDPGADAGAILLAAKGSLAGWTEPVTLTTIVAGDPQDQIGEYMLKDQQPFYVREGAPAHMGRKGP